MKVTIDLGTMNGWTGKEREFKNTILEFLMQDETHKMRTTQLARCYDKVTVETDYVEVTYNVDYSD